MLKQSKRMFTVKKLMKNKLESIISNLHKLKKMKVHKIRQKKVTNHIHYRNLK